MTAHPLAGRFSVEASARRIRHYRYVEERMMRMLGGWIALTPELSAKLLLGRHVWDCAQHADLWGRRLPELRALAHRSEPPDSAFVRFMDTLEGPEAFHQTPERLVGVYRVLKPCLLAAYERHQVEANAVYEPPTRRIFQRCIDEERRHVAAGQAILRHVAAAPGPAARAAEWEARLRADLAGTTGIGGDGVIEFTSPPSRTEPDIAQDLVQLERPVGRWPAPDDLRSAVDAHGQALAAGDLGVLESQVRPSAWAEAAACYRELTGLAAPAVMVVACGRIGGHWLVKQRLVSVTGSLVLQTRWVPGEAGWEVAEAEVVRREPPA